MTGATTTTITVAGHSPTAIGGAVIIARQGPPRARVRPKGSKASKVTASAGRGGPARRLQRADATAARTAAMRVGAPTHRGVRAARAAGRVDKRLRGGAAASIESGRKFRPDSVFLKGNSGDSAAF